MCRRRRAGGQPLETESARLIKRGSFELEAGFERQTSSAGTESAAPLALEYGLTDRLELLVEPVLYTAIHDKGAHLQHGVGDVETTLTFLLARERPGLPAFAIAGEAKFPTARNVRIGSGKADFSAYLIGSKRAGRWDTHGNLGYTIVGRPAGAQVSNTYSFALAAELRVSPRVEVVAESFGSTAALKESAGTPLVSQESLITPEIGGGEFVGALGLRYRPAGGLAYSLGLSVDSNGAVLVHPGVALRW